MTKVVLVRNPKLSKWKTIGYVVDGLSDVSEETMRSCFDVSAHALPPGEENVEPERAPIGLTIKLDSDDGGH